MTQRRATIVYDGSCIFCSRSMAWIVRHDVNRVVSLTPCTSETGARLMREHGIDPKDPATFLVIIDGRPFVRSAAMVALVPLLDRPAQTLRVFGLIPDTVRNIVYDWTARNRRRLLKGKCPVPTPEMRRRMIV